MGDMDEVGIGVTPWSDLLCYLSLICWFEIEKPLWLWHE